MFEREITLWLGGPVVTLGSYFIAYRYLFCFLVLALALSLLRWPRPSVLLGGALILGGSGWLAFDEPLGRPYGLGERGIVFEELGEPMVAAALRSPTEGVLSAAPSRWPFWSLLLSLSAGLEPGRLLELYSWLPLVSLVLLGCASYYAFGAPSSGPDSVARMVPALAVFFILFLSVPRLSFLESGGGPLWPELFWLRPRLGVGLAIALVAFGRFARAESLSAYLLGGLALGIASWIEPRWLTLGGAGVFLWAAVQWRLKEPVWRATLGLGLAAALSFAWTSRSGSASFRAEDFEATWHGVVNSILAVSLDQGAVFYLALFAIACACRERSRSQLLLVCWLGVGYAAWVLASVSGEMARSVDPAIVKSFLRVLLAATASLGAHRVLLWIEEKWRTPPTLPAILRGRSTAPSSYTLGLAALVALSLPWSFPFWWNPVRMDSVYVESVEPISHEYTTFGDWIRQSTSPDAVFVTGPSYAPWIPALSGRRVLLLDDVAPVPRRRDREQAFRWITGSREREPILAAASAWGVTHVAWGRLDADVDTDLEFEFLESSPLFSLVYQQRRWIRVFELRP
jgi:hypothetical protein